MFDFTLEQWRLWLRHFWLWLWNMRHTKYKKHTGFLYMGKIQKMLKMPTDTFNNKETTRTAGVAAVPDWAWLCVFTWNLFPVERLLVIRAQPRHLLIHLQLDRRPALRVLTQTRPRTLLHLPSRAANEQSRSLNRECPNAPTRAFFWLNVQCAFTLKTLLRHY